MTWISEFVRYLSVLGDPRLEPGTVEGLPPFALRQTADALKAAGWTTTYEYNGDDAWIDYARIDMRKGRSKLRILWDPDSGGSIDAPQTVLEGLRPLDPWMGEAGEGRIDYQKRSSGPR
jgi:hypothetical protein